MAQRDKATHPRVVRRIGRETRAELNFGLREFAMEVRESGLVEQVGIIRFNSSFNLPVMSNPALQEIQAKGGPAPESLAERLDIDPSNTPVRLNMKRPAIKPFIPPSRSPAERLVFDSLLDLGIRPINCAHISKISLGFSIQHGEAFTPAVVADAAKIAKVANGVRMYIPDEITVLWVTTSEAVDLPCSELGDLIQTLPDHLPEFSAQSARVINI